MVRTAGVLMLLVAASVAQETARLRPSKPLDLRRNYALPAGAKQAAELVTRKGRLGKFEVFFLDVDGNGKFNDLGVDGWSLPKMPYMLPLEKTVVIGRSVVSLAVAEDGAAVQWERTPMFIEKWQEKVLVDFNTFRLMNGLPGVNLDRKLSAGCRQHCLYMDKHGMTHDEEAGKEGYSEEGAHAGKRSCIAPFGPRTSVLAMYASFYHRLPLIHPDTRSIGIGVSRRFTAIDGLSERRRRNWRYPIIVPAPNSWFQPTHFARESPRPYPEELEQPGFPITLLFDTKAITEVEAELRLKNGKGRRVPILVSSPERPANKKRAWNRQSICIIPRSPLAPKKTWWVAVHYKRNGKLEAQEWLFNTGPSRPVFRR